MTATSPCAPFLPNSATCTLITARTSYSAAYRLTSLPWQTCSSIFCKILQSLSTNGTDGDGKHAGICRKRRRRYHCVNFFPRWRRAFAASCQLWQFQAVSCPRKSGKRRKRFASRSRQLGIRYGFGIFLSFFFFFLHPASRPWGFVYCEKRLWKAKWRERGLFSHLTVGNPGEAERFHFRVFRIDGAMSHF